MHFRFRTIQLLIETDLTTPVELFQRYYKALLQRAESYRNKRPFVKSNMQMTIGTVTEYRKFQLHSFYNCKNN